MDKSHTELLGEIRSELEKLKEALSALELKLAECEAGSTEEAADFTDFEIGSVEDGDLPEAEQVAVAEPKPEVEVVEPEAVAEFEPEVEVELEPEVEVDFSVEPEPVVEVEPAPAVVAEPETGPEPEPAPEPEPEPEPEPAPKPKAKPFAEGNYQWMQARPGVSVKHIRSGISLLDRAQFITILFKEDYALYDSTLATLESMDSLEDAVAYLMDQFPQWNYKSDIVFSFMMAVRKKLG
ncbi:MAG: hypothetical protein II652_06075 [Bacteroidales bacterium]|nr:hypothetical protein [Bacteroidales bacterium]MBQ4299279.1 hypothetical protein [Bacteroidales bacterium]